MLPEDKRLQLDGIVQQMTQNKESDNNIRFVVDDFKKKYTPIETAPVVPKRDLLGKAESIIGNIFPGRQLGKAIGNSAYGIGQLFKGNVQGFNESADENGRMVGKVAGDVAQSVALPLSMAVNPAGGILKSAAQYGGLSALAGGGAALAKGNTLPQASGEALKSGAIGAGLGAGFNLLGKGISAVGNKLAPTSLSFTSGVPKKAIEQSLENPNMAKQGLKMSVEQVREKASESLKGLRKDLSSEFEGGLDKVISETGQTKGGMTYNQKGFMRSSNAMRKNLVENTKAFARQFRLSTKTTPEGLTIDFSKSPIVKPGEKNAVQEAFSTINGWKDFSAKGTQDLAERIGALRNFESGAKTESSVIISKIYNKIAGTGGSKGIISEFYPKLAELRTNFSVNKRILDNIGNIIGEGAKKPTQIQAAVSRLDNIFAENKDEYINIIKQLGEKSGVDYLSLLSGGEFQKILPNFVRGLGGGGALSVGAAVINPYLLLLAPLFSPRAVGAITRNAPAVAKTTSQLVRSGTTQAIPVSTQQSGQQ